MNEFVDIIIIYFVFVSSSPSWAHGGMATSITILDETDRKSIMV